MFCKNLNIVPGALPFDSACHRIPRTGRAPGGRRRACPARRATNFLVAHLIALVLVPKERVPCLNIVFDHIPDRPGHGYFFLASNSLALSSHARMDQANSRR
jgi:hypothetical protein